MHSDHRTYFDTVTYFARSSLQGTLMPELDGTDLKAWHRYWHAAPIRVRNARLLDPAPTLESHGFELFRCKSEVEESQPLRERIQIYKNEALRLVEELSDCRESRCLNIVFRGGFDDKDPGELLDKSDSEIGIVYNYSRYAHTDISPWLEMQPLWNKFANERHCAVYNVWRNTDLKNSVERLPLAVCDPQSVTPANMVAAYGPGLLPDGNRMILYNLVHSPFQSWYYYPYLTHHEALVFKLYDTREATGSKRGVFHSAVNDPDSAADGKRRESIDMRIGAVFENETEHEARRARHLAELPPVPQELYPKPSNSNLLTPSDNQAFQDRKF